jgi:hypothetical protein
VNNDLTDLDWKILNAAEERPLLYIAGPMTTHGHPYMNVRNGILAGQKAFELGWAPIVPHLSAFWEISTGDAGHSRWLELDFAYLRSVEAGLFLPEWEQSKGASAEHRLLTHWRRPRFYGFDDLPSAEEFLLGDY